MSNSNVDKFIKKATDTLIKITDIVEEYDTAGIAEIEYEGEIIKISFAKQVYVLNKHNGMREIWLVSPISGPYHFGYIDGKWVDTKNNNTLLETLLSKEFSTFIRRIKFNL
jgi:CyaY protein